VEIQGHGRTADKDRAMSFATMGDDIAVLLDHLKIPKTDLVGRSFGGAQPELSRNLPRNCYSTRRWS
jgi:pimeloyl-ACP methyl ester carboxylesterase